MESGGAEDCKIVIMARARSSLGSGNSRICLTLTGPSHSINQLVRRLF